jgi:hypothetical protein
MLSGTIPSEVIQLQSLTAFLVDNTALTGSIPDKVGENIAQMYNYK